MKRRLKIKKEDHVEKEMVLPEWKSNEQMHQVVCRHRPGLRPWQANAVKKLQQQMQGQDIQRPGVLAQNTDAAVEQYGCLLDGSSGSPVRNSNFPEHLNGSFLGFQSQLRGNKIKSDPWANATVFSMYRKRLPELRGDPVVLLCLRLEAIFLDLLSAKRPNYGIVGQTIAGSRERCLSQSGPAFWMCLSPGTFGTCGSARALQHTCDGERIT